MSNPLELDLKPEPRSAFVALLQRWQGLQPREQRALALLALAALATALYLLVWQPLQQHLQESRQWQQNQLALNQHLLRNAPLLLQHSHIRSTLAPEQLQGTVTASAQRAGLSIERYENSAESLNLNLSQAPFNALITWLNQLEQSGVVLSQAHISRSDNGLVNARLSLRTYASGRP